MMSLLKRMKADSFGHQPFMSESKADNSNEFEELTEQSEHKGSEGEMKGDEDSVVKYNEQINDLKNALFSLKNENKKYAMDLHLKREECVKLNEENLKLEQDAKKTPTRETGNWKPKYHIKTTKFRNTKKHYSMHNSKYETGQESSRNCKRKMQPIRMVCIMLKKFLTT